MQKNYGVKFSGIGMGLPEKTVKNTDLEKLYDTSDEWIYSRTGIKERRVVSKNESGLSLCVKASREALLNSKTDPKDIDLIIVCTTTPDKLYPSMSCMLQGELGALNAACFDLSAACSGFVYGIVTASQFIYTGECKNILLVGVDIHSRFLNWSERSVSILFGDGAGAVLMTRCLAKEDEVLGYVIKSRSDVSLDLALDNQNTAYAELQKTKEPNFVKMNGKAVYQFALEVVPDIVNQLLDNINLKNSDIDYFVPHQANQRIIDSCAKKLGFKENQVISNIEKVGNTSSASIPIAVYDGLLKGKIKAPSKVLMVGFGAGLTWGAVAINWKIKL